MTETDYHPGTDGFADPFCRSVKEPALQIRPKGRQMPTVVFETGWGDKFRRMNDDVRLWFNGSRGQVQVVILIKWDIQNGEFIGRVEVYRAGNSHPEIQVSV